MWFDVMCYAIYHMCYAIYDMIYDKMIGRYFISDTRHGRVYDTLYNMMYVSAVCVRGSNRQKQRVLDIHRRGV